MDEDIQDILNSVSAPEIPQRTLDVQALTRAWVNERTSPELLPYPTNLIERVIDRIKKQVRWPIPDIRYMQVLTARTVDRNN